MPSRSRNTKSAPVRASTSGASRYCDMKVYLEQFEMKYEAIDLVIKETHQGIDQWAGEFVELLDPRRIRNKQMLPKHLESLRLYANVHLMLFMMELFERLRDDFNKGCHELGKRPIDWSTRFETAVDRLHAELKRREGAVMQEYKHMRDKEAYLNEVKALRIFRVDQKILAGITRTTRSSKEALHGSDRTVTVIGVSYANLGMSHMFKWR